MYSRSIKEHMDHVRGVLQRLQVTGFTSNPDKMNIGICEVKQLCNSLNSRAIMILPETLEAINA